MHGIVSWPRCASKSANRAATSAAGPPYGYRLVDAGPHPNQAHAQWGRRLRRLDPDPLTAPHVRWIFARRLSGVSVAGIARELNEHGIPCPSVPIESEIPTGRGRAGR